MPPCRQGEIFMYVLNLMHVFIPFMHDISYAIYLFNNKLLLFSKTNVFVIQYHNNFNDFKKPLGGLLERTKELLIRFAVSNLL